jgi:hypothetical protein
MKIDQEMQNQMGGNMGHGNMGMGHSGMSDQQMMEQAYHMAMQMGINTQGWS